MALRAVLQVILALFAAPLGAEAQEAGHSLVTSNRFAITRR